MSKNDENELGCTTSRERKWVVLGIVIMALLVYREVIAPGQLMVTTDDNIGELAARKAQLPSAFLGGWNHLVLAGTPMYLHLNVTNILLWLLPVRIFANWIHAVDLGIASLGLYFFLRLRGRTSWACAMGALLAFWFGSTFTLNYAGHLGKFGAMLFTGPYLYCAERAVRSRKLPWALLAGGCMGGMFLEQADLALFLAIPLGMYALYRGLTEYKLKLLPVVKLCLPIVVVAGLLAFRPIWAAQSVFVQDVAVVDQEEDPQKAWNYSTQWSWPPDETIDWIAPGYMGWRSGEPKGPYWGRMGQSPEWPLTQQGFRNFRLETHYLGGIPLVFSALALFVVLGLRGRAGAGRGEIIFWSAVTLVTYLLALGKFFFLYKIFYQFPGVSSIRNPVKFIQVTQLALGILAAYGFDLAFTQRNELKETQDGHARIRKFVWGVLAVGGLMVIAAIHGSSTQPAMVERLVKDGWAGVAEVIASNRVKGLFHGGVLILVAGGILRALLSSAREKSREVVQWLAWALIGIMVVDQLAMSKHFVSRMRLDDYVGENEIVRSLKQGLGQQRAFFTTQQAFYNQWLGVTFPYHGVPSFNVAQIRMPEDYGAFLKASSSNLPRMCQLAAVGLVLGPSQIWGQIQNAPGLKDAFELAVAYNVGQEGQALRVLPATEQQPGRHCIVRTKIPAPRVALLGGWDVVEDEQALQNIADPSYPLFERLMIGPETAEGLPPSSGEGIIGKLRFKQFDGNQISLQVTAPGQAILRFAEKYDPYWKAWIDGEPAQVRRCDYLFQGVLVPAGIHEVVWKYVPVRWPLVPQVAALALCLMAGILLFIRRNDKPVDA